MFGLLASIAIAGTFVWNGAAVSAPFRNAQGAVKACEKHQKLFGSDGNLRPEFNQLNGTEKDDLFKGYSECDAWVRK